MMRNVPCKPIHLSYSGLVIQIVGPSPKSVTMSLIYSMQLYMEGLHPTCIGPIAGHNSIMSRLAQQEWKLFIVQ